MTASSLGSPLHGSETMVMVCVCKTDPSTDVSCYRVVINILLHAMRCSYCNKVCVRHRCIDKQIAYRVRQTHKVIVQPKAHDSHNDVYCLTGRYNTGNSGIIAIPFVIDAIQKGSRRCNTNKGVPVTQCIACIPT